MSRCELYDSRNDKLLKNTEVGCELKTWPSGIT